MSAYQADQTTKRRAAFDTADWETYEKIVHETLQVEEDSNLKITLVTLSELNLTDEEFEKRRFQLAQNPKISEFLDAAEEGKYNMKQEPSIKLDKTQTLEMLKLT